MVTETDRNGPKRTFVDTGTVLGTETDFIGYRNGLFGYKIVIRGAKNDRNTKYRYKL